MKKNKIIGVCLIACAIVGLSSLVACNDSKAEQHNISGNNVTFYVDGKLVISAEKGETVSVDYIEKIGYTYELSVKNGETEITVENNSFTMPDGNVEVTLTPTLISYDVIAPDNVVFTLGVENGKTTVEDSISFTLDLETETVAGLVTVNGEEVDCEDGAYSFLVKDYFTAAHSNLTITVETEAKTYEVIAPEIVSFKNGVKNGMTERADTVEFLVNMPLDRHLISVATNGKTLTANNDIYSFDSAEMLQTTDNIEIVVETEKHTWQTTVVEETCTKAGYSLYFCDCGISHVVDEKLAKNLIVDVSQWYDGISLENLDSGIKATQATEATWSQKRRVLSIDPTEFKFLSVDFDSLTASQFSIQFFRIVNGITDYNTIYPKKILKDSGRYVFSLQEDMGITELGLYYLTIYLDGTQGTSVMIRELALLDFETETVHNYDGSVTVEECCHQAKSSIMTCLECGFTHIESEGEARFLFAEPAKWSMGGNVSLLYTEQKANITITNDDGWGWMSRNVSLKTTDYLLFTANGKFKIEIGAADSTHGRILLDSQLYTGNTVCVPVSELVEEDGEYRIFIYPEASQGVTQAVSEFFILSNEAEDVHRYENGGTECIICGKKKEND